MTERTSGTLDYQYKGPGRRKTWFEGWYFKLQLDEETTLSLIPSLHRSTAEDHGSLQWILSKGQELYSGSFHYPMDRVLVRKKPFQLILGHNEFSEDRIRIQEADLVLAADFDRVRTYARDIMGPFRYLHESMPCSHGLLVTDGRASVSLVSPRLTGVFTSRLYVEKDWGDTFPERYIWFQADFPEKNSSIFFSIATVKVGSIGFTGFIANLVLDGRDYTFATWNLATCIVRGSPRDIRVGLSGGGLKVALRILPGESVNLKSPVEGAMNDRVRESLSAPIEMNIRSRSGGQLKLSAERATVEYHGWF